ncbi:MAG: glycosyltransferase family 4 protein [Anaerolineae bacterium]
MSTLDHIDAVIMGASQPITILYTDHGEGLGGAENSLLILMRHLERDHFRPVLACEPGPLAQAARALGLEVCTTDFPRLRGHLLALPRLWRGGWALASLVRRHHAAILHSNTMRASFSTALASLLTSCPMIWHAHDLYGPGRIGGRWYPRLMSRLAHAVIANSHAVARTIPRPDVHVIHNGIEVEHFHPQLSPSAARAQLGLPETGVLIGTVGRMQPWKGHHVFLKVAHRVSALLPDARFLIVGGQVFAADADYAERLHRLAHELGIAQRVHFAGHQTDVAPWLAAMDVFVHCSEAEPFGLVVVEAMAAARPVVAFADGGVPEIVLDGETGILVMPGDVSHMAEAVAKLAVDRDLAQRVGRAGRERAETNFSATRYVRQIEELYEEILARRGP